MTLIILLAFFIGFCLGRAYNAAVNQPKERVKK